ncbi:MAG: hypothetical protein IJA51_00260 [Oscillospiraceae bacterium]|nr:hypothetical protein [Oscillospiraceae bacterium]
MTFESRKKRLSSAKARFFLTVLIFALTHIALLWLLRGTLYDTLSLKDELDRDAVIALGVVLSAGFWCSSLYQVHVLCRNGNAVLVDKLLISQFSMGILLAITYSALLFVLCSAMTGTDRLIHSLVYCTDIGLCQSTAKFYSKAQF